VQLRALQNSQSGEGCCCASAPAVNRLSCEPTSKAMNAQLAQDQFYWKGKKAEDLTREELLEVIGHLSFELRMKRNLIDYLANKNDR
jgi:hypothetical protein